MYIYIHIYNYDMMVMVVSTVCYRFSNRMQHESFVQYFNTQSPWLLLSALRHGVSGLLKAHGMACPT